MKVLSQANFVSVIAGKTFCVNVGDVLELPKGADWIRAGFVTPIAEAEAPKVKPSEAAAEEKAAEAVPDVAAEAVAAPETASIAPGETEVLPKAQPHVMSTKSLKGKK